MSEHNDVEVHHYSGFWPNYRETVKIALPVSISLLGQMAMGTTDVIFIGRLGPNELAGTSLGATFYFQFFMVTIGFIMASTGLISQFRGQGNHRLIRRTVRQAIWLAILFSIPFCIALSFMEELMLLFGQNPEVANIAGRYSDYYLIGFLPATTFVAFRCFFVGLQKSNMAAVLIWLAVPINALLDYVLIFGAFGFPAMHVEGAGLASSITSILMLLGACTLVSIDKEFKSYQVLKNFWRPDWEIFKKLFRLGLPISVRVSLEEGVFLISAVMIGWIGAQELAAHTIITTILAISFMIGVGIADGATSRVGYEFGAKNYPQAKKNGWIGMSVSLTYTLLACLLVFAFPLEIVSLILDPSTPNADAVLAIASSVIIIAAITQIPDGGQLAIAGCLAGINDTKSPMYTALFCYWGVGFVAAWIFAFELEMGIVGFWYGLLIGLSGNMIVNMVRFWWITKSDARLDQQQLLATEEHLEL